MTKITFANRFGLIALALVSLFASTAFATSPTQVVVTNSPAQPVPMVGVIKDTDAPARKSFQTTSIGFFVDTPQFVVSVPNNERLVVEHVSGYCSGATGGTLYMYSDEPTTHSIHGLEYLTSDVTIKVISDPVRFYVDPGLNLNLRLINTPSGVCHITISGYYVSLP